MSSHRVVTFGQLKPRLINILMSALQIETDSLNTHILLGGLLLCVQDSVNFEEFDSASSDANSTSARETNLLSSGEYRLGIVTFFRQLISSIFIFIPKSDAFYFCFSIKFHHEPFLDHSFIISNPIREQLKHQHALSAVATQSQVERPTRATEIRAQRL